MKKTLFLLICTIIITGLLFFSGTYLLDLAAHSDAFELAFGAGAGSAGEGADDQDDSETFSFFKHLGANPSGDLMDILRGFKQTTGEPVCVLLLAGDEGINTDAIMALRYDPKSGGVGIISIPRDTYITLKGYKFHKINSVYSVKGGAEKLKDLVGDILGVKIEYYVHINMKTVREAVDLLGGVEYDVPCDMKYDDPDQNLHINLKQGRRTLTGKQVEGLLRFRKPNKWTDSVKKYYDGSDLKRIERQHDFFKEMLRQKLNVKYVTKINEIVNTVYSNITTDLPLSEMLKLSRALPGISSDTFRTETLPGAAKTIDGLSYFILDEKLSRALVEEVFI